MDKIKRTQVTKPRRKYSVFVKVLLFILLCIALLFIGYFANEIVHMMFIS